MSKHTPGPWMITGEDERFVYALSSKGTNSFSCLVSPGYIQGYDSEETQQANARLIAAATDMLEELEKLLECIEFYHLDNLYFDTDKTKQVIAKAKGKE